MDRTRIIKESLDSDIFVNNAYANDVQLHLLKDIFVSWSNMKGKLIINISSRYTTDSNSYCMNKKEQDSFCENNQFKYPTIINLKPGLTDTYRVLNESGPKMSPNNVVEVLDYILESRKRNLTISSITFGIKK
jgi:hypothetical protein